MAITGDGPLKALVLGTMQTTLQEGNRDQKDSLLSINQAGVENDTGEERDNKDDKLASLRAVAKPGASVQKTVVHNLILSAHSPEFQAMLVSDMVEKLQSDITIEYACVEVVRQKVQYMYMAKANYGFDRIKELLMLANKYQVLELVNFFPKTKGVESVDEETGQPKPNLEAAETETELLTHVLEEKYKEEAEKNDAMKNITAEMKDKEAKIQEMEKTSKILKTSKKKKKNLKNKTHQKFNKFQKIKN